MKFKKIISLLTILIICLVFLTGCYSSTALETMAYAVAIGLDQGTNNTLKLSIQLAVLNTTSNRRKFLTISEFCC
jgi:hypothetical protein